MSSTGEPGGLSRRVKLVNRDGLHARSCAALAKLARRFRGARLTLRFRSAEADARSVLELMTLAAPCGADIELVASGRRADRLLERAVRLVEGGFGES